MTAISEGRSPSNAKSAYAPTFWTAGGRSHLTGLIAVAVSRRACEGIVRLVAALVGAADGDQAGGAAPTRRLVPVDALTECIALLAEDTAA